MCSVHGQRISLIRKTECAGPEYDHVDQQAKSKPSFQASCNPAAEPTQNHRDRHLPPATVTVTRAQLTATLINSIYCCVRSGYTLSTTTTTTSSIPRVTVAFSVDSLLDLESAATISKKTTRHDTTLGLAQAFLPPPCPRFRPAARKEARLHSTPWPTTSLITRMLSHSEFVLYNRSIVYPGAITDQDPTRFAEPERKHASPSPSHYENKPMPPRPQEGYGRPHAASAGRLSPAGHPSGGHHNTHSGVMSPPPTGGPKPTHHNRPPPISRPPPSPAPTDGGADPTLLPLFRAVDKDGTYHTQLGLR